MDTRPGTDTVGVGALHFRQVNSIHMTVRSVVFGIAVLLIGLNAARAEPPPTGVDDPAAHYRSLLDRYCVTCHNEVLKTAGMILETANVADVGEAPEVWERVITKLSLSAMPPVGIPHPDESFYDGFLDYLQTELDQAAHEQPNPGRSTVHRLNRTEYANAIHDLLAVEIDVAALLPPDNVGEGFDNIAEVLAVSPLLMEQYLFAAGRISNLAVGPRSMQPASETYAVSDAFRQQQRMGEELPFGSRGGTVVKHRFPLDGEYTVDIRLQRNIEGYIRGIRDEHILDVRLDHERIGTLNVGGEVHGPSGPTFTINQVVQYAGDADQVGYEFTADENLQIRFNAEAGTHLVGVTFADDNAKPTGILTPELTLPDIESYKGGVATVASVTITGPYEPRGPGVTASRNKIFVCHPPADALPEEEERCARTILAGLGRQAYRRPVTDADVDNLLGLYREGRSGEDFEGGIGLALQGILAGPEFLFRVEQDPAGARAGDVHPV
ncbi:MAG: DUF1587 domain-containing protein, partial [Gammaproteobacteria bacterium]|nr:DUF1587 domain-containing protein [Gammaproteobacteria bacterium]